MAQDRRQFLRLFGASSAAIVGASGVEKIRDDDAPAQFQRDHSSSFPDPKQFRITPRVLYSQFQIPKNGMAASYDLFGRYLGDGSDFTVTNMKSANRLPMPQTFLVTRIGVSFSPKTEPGLRSAFCDRYAIQFRIANLTMEEKPLSLAFSVGEPRGEKGFAESADVLITQRWDEYFPIIDIGSHFGCTLFGTPIHPCGKLTGWGVIEGLLASPIQ